MIVQLHQLIVCSTSNNCAQLLVLLQTWSLVALIYNNWIFYIPTADEIEAGFEMEPAMCTTTRNIGGWIALADLIRQKIINIGSIAIGSICNRSGKLLITNNVRAGDPAVGSKNNILVYS